MVGMVNQNYRCQKRTEENTPLTKVVSPEGQEGQRSNPTGRAVLEDHPYSF